VSLRIDKTISFLRVRLGGATIGLPASAIREIVRAVAITPLPGAPDVVEGAVNLRGRLVPVIDVRRRFGLPVRSLHDDEFLVFLEAGDQLRAMRVDDVDDLVDADADDVAPSGTLSPALQGLAGVAARADGVLVIYDPSAFLTQAESAALDRSLAASA
jgi:purine-binding chemotaxis protein CheW